MGDFLFSYAGQVFSDASGQGAARHGSGGAGAQKV
jgi:hypothetical protein